jgi:hypothetical protein
METTHPMAHPSARPPWPAAEMHVIRRRPIVVDLRDWLACLALLLASVLMAVALLLGYGLVSAVNSVYETPATGEVTGQGELPCC